MIHEGSKGDITKSQKVFQGKESTIVHYFENLLKDYTGHNFRLIVDEWLLTNIFFSAIKKDKATQVRELLEFEPKLVFGKDHQHNNVFHVLSSCIAPEELLPFILARFNTPHGIKQILNKVNLFGQTPISLAITLRKRR